MTAVLPKFPPNAFLSDVQTYSVGRDGIQGDPNSAFDALAIKSVATGQPELVIEPANSSRPFRSAIAIPIYRGEKVVSVVVLATAATEGMSGVFEIWSTIGQYEELGLSKGYFGDLLRFQNVSSFVRFEKGSGLPGQVWNGLRSVIHDDLSNHPGFLRAAGASADSLSVALGIPVCGAKFCASVLLISSTNTPIARGFEVWRADPDGFTLESCSYASDEIRLPIDTKLASTNGLLGATAKSGVATLSDDEAALLAGRTSTGVNAVASGLAIPFFESDTLTSITVLLF